jgi:hypothetical protein
MITFLVFGIIGYALVKIWISLIPGIMERRFLKNAQIVKDIQDMYESKSRLDKRLEDYCKKHPESCKDLDKFDFYSSPVKENTK